MSILIAYLIIGATCSLGLLFDHYRETDIKDTKDKIYSILFLILIAFIWPLVLYTTRYGTRK